MTENEIVEAVKNAFPTTYRTGQAYALCLKDNTGKVIRRVSARIDQFPVIHFYFPVNQTTLAHMKIRKDWTIEDMGFSYDHDILEWLQWHEKIVKNYKV